MIFTLMVLALGAALEASLPPEGARFCEHDCESLELVLVGETEVEAVVFAGSVDVVARVTIHPDRPRVVLEVPRRAHGAYQVEVRSRRPGSCRRFVALPEDPGAPREERPRHRFPFLRESLAASVQAKLVNPQGTPVSGVEVELVGEADAPCADAVPIARVDSSGEQGLVVFERLPPGDYRLSVATGTDFEERVAFPLASGMDIDLGSVWADIRGQITGAIDEETEVVSLELLWVGSDPRDPRPPAGPTLPAIGPLAELDPDADRLPRRMEALEGNRFELAGVEPGRYVLFGLDEAGNRVVGARLDLAPAATVEIALEPVAFVRERVTLEGRAAPGRVCAFGDDGVLLAPCARFGDDGVIDLPVARPPEVCPLGIPCAGVGESVERYRPYWAFGLVQASDGVREGYSTRQIGHFRPGVESGWRERQLPSGSRILQFSWPDGRGVVMPPPTGGLTIELRQGDPEGLSQLKGGGALTPHGFVTFYRVPSSRYFARARFPLPDGDNRLLDFPLPDAWSLREGSAHRIVLPFDRPRAWLLVDRTGWPLAWTEVAWRSGDGWSFGETDEDGRIVTPPGVVAGSALWILAAGEPPRRGGVIVFAQRQDGVVVPLDEPAHALEAVIVGEDDGAPVAGVAWSMDGDAVPAPILARYLDRAGVVRTTNDEGRATLPRLPEGIWTIRLDGARAGGTEVELGRPTRLEIVRASPAGELATSPK